MDSVLINYDMSTQWIPMKLLKNEEDLYEMMWNYFQDILLNPKRAQIYYKMLPFFNVKKRGIQ